MRWFDAEEDSWGCQMYHNRVPDCRDQLIFWKGASREGGQVMCGYDDILSPNSVVGGCNEGDTDSNGRCLSRSELLKQSQSSRELLRRNICQKLSKHKLCET